MTNDSPTPDHLHPGSTIGPWHILDELGRDDSCRVFLVERDGRLFTLKMGLHPASSTGGFDEGGHGRFERELHAHLLWRGHPHIPLLHTLDWWPHAQGFPFFVVEYVEGEAFNAWRWEHLPNAAALVDAFSGVVRLVAEMHRRDTYLRSLQACDILIRQEDGRPFLVNLGHVRPPAAGPLPPGPPPGPLHLQPPEAIAFLRAEAWKQGARFEGGVAADLHALGVLFYEALGDTHPFNPKLPAEELMAAIETVVPRPLHYLHPKVPRSLSDITSRLLSKRPEDRYPSAEALLQALWEAAKERSTPEWREPLELPAEGPAEMTAEELLERVESQRAARAMAKAAPPSVPEPPPPATPEGAPVAAPAPIVGPAPTRRSRRLPALLAVGACLGFLFLALGLARATLALLSVPGGVSVLTRDSRDSSTSTAEAPRVQATAALSVALCLVYGIGCATVPEKPPRPWPCPQETLDVMWKELKLKNLDVIVDVNQPGHGGEHGVFRDGPITSQLARASGELPAGSLLFGQLWSGPDVYLLGTGRPAVMIRYTTAQRPDGKRFPVCIVIGSEDGRVHTRTGSQPGASVIPRRLPATAVWSWP